MANSTCTTPLKVVAIRGLRLDGSGEILSGASSQYRHQAPVLMGYTPTQADRDRFEQNDGNGDQCLLYLGPEKPVEAVELRMDLCQLDAELTEFLCGGSIITSGYDTIGYLAPTDDTVNENGVALEVWALAWAGRQRALLGGAPAYYRFVFPKTKWRQGEHTLQNGVTVVPVTGVSEVNSGFGTGLVADPFPADVGNSAYGWALVDDVPAGACGYQAVA